MSFFKKAAAAILWRIFRLFPVDPQKIAVTSFYGKGYSDNPKGIVDALLRENAQVKILWLVRPGSEASLPSGVTPVPYDSIRRIFTLATAKVWIDNNRKGAPFKRKNQIYLQTWHGLALKRIERDAAEKLPPDYEAYAKRDSAQCDAIVSNCAHMTRIFRTSFWFNGEILEYGSPRNDVLFSDRAPYLSRVQTALRLSPQRRLLLYGPTFRADHTTQAYQLDCAALLEACKTRFGGDWTVLIRLHPAVEQLSGALFPYDGIHTVNATSYPDITELLAACDVVVTDYSSLMFDFALTGRPCFQFATDIAAYEKDRNFYFPLSRLPFPLAASNAALCNAVTSFDESDYASRWSRFSAEFGLFEDGRASSRCAEWILSHMKI